jgi:D-alanyl-D-alanine carboxypeptidase (penicillin-binding protein 5/6)
MPFKKIISVLFLLVFSPYLQAERTGDIVIPALPRLAASSYILQDFDSGKILAERNADKTLAPASLTKIMTAYVAFTELKAGRLTLEETVTVSEKAWRTQGSKMFIEVNKRVTIENLLQGMMIQSGNDASVAVAEHIAGSEQAFAEMMNEQARNLGMNSTHFMNATGLPVPEQHYTTARDLATLTRAVIRNFPEYYKWYSVKQFTFNNITQKNRNTLLWRDESVDGVKTGYTAEAGYCLVVSAKRQKMRLVSVVLGTKSTSARANESQTLLNYGFRFFETHKLYDANTVLASARVWKGATETVKLGVKEDFFVTISRRHYTEMKATVDVGYKIIAPIEKGSQLGSVNVLLRNTIVSSKPLVALNEIETGSFFQRAYDSALMLITSNNGK